MPEKILSRLRRIQAQAEAVFDEDRITFFSEKDLPWLHRFAHFWVMVGKSFWRNRCPVRASALAYTTLLAIVPLLAVGISISTSLLKTEDGQKQIQQVIDTMVAKIAPQLDLVSKDEDGASGRQGVARSISDYINNVSSGKLGAAAIIALVFVAISLLSTIEATVNDIWGVMQGRTWLARIEKYWAVICFAPILLLLVMGLKVGPYFETTTQLLSGQPFLAAVVYTILPMVMVILAFAGFYKLMPNTKVTWSAAFVGGVVGGCLWQLNNAFSVAFFGQQVMRNSEIYGKLALVPVFLIGLYFSWLIVLFGAQVAYAYQNRRAYIQERQAENVNERGREFIALRLMTLIAQHFFRGDRPPTSAQIAESLCVPSQLIHKVMNPLLQTKLLLEVASKKADDVAYVPGRPLDRISYQDVLNSIRAGQGRELETRDEPSRTLVRGKFEQIMDAEQRVAGSITLQSLVERNAGIAGEKGAISSCAS